MRRCVAVLVALALPLTILVPASATSASVARAGSPFTDVATSHVFFEEMAWLAEEEISRGYDNGDGTVRFEPSAPVLREQMAAFLYRLEGEPAFDAKAGSPFTDVSTSHVFFEEMAWLAEEEISRGYDNGDDTTRFEPSAPVLREQMAAFLYRLEHDDDAQPGETILDVSGTIAAGTTWGPQEADVYRITGDVTVPAGVTLTLRPGTVVKLAQGRTLQVDGTLRADGTAAAPVVLTSVKDDAVGGDTNGDGTSSSPGPGDFVGVSVRSTGTVAMAHARIAHADVAISASGVTSAAPTVTLSETAISASAWCVVARGPVRGTFSGSVRDCHAGVTADHAFDARDVDWGSPNGPSPYGTGVPISGESIAVLPWRGYLAPARPPVAAPQPPPFSAECRDVVLVGVRGSGEFPQGPDPETPPPFWSDEIGFGSPNLTIATSLEERIRQLRPSTTVKRMAVQYLALRSPVYDPGVDYERYVGSVFDGVDKLDQLIESEAARCPSSQFVLLGSSQGALVIHMVLSAADRPENESRIAGVVLLSDPARVAGTTETLWEAAGLPAAAGVRDVSGVWKDFYPGVDRPVPAWASSRTISLCHQGDSVCAFRPGASIGPHLTYSTAELSSLGEWQGARLAEALPER